jgi:hypothetical protein
MIRNQKRYRESGGKNISFSFGTARLIIAGAGGIIKKYTREKTGSGRFWGTDSFEKLAETGGIK